MQLLLSVYVHDITAAPVHLELLFPVVLKSTFLKKHLSCAPSESTLNVSLCPFQPNTVNRHKGLLAI